MLAPRKTLWTTPQEAVEIAANRVRLDGQDTLVDIGCGDGRVLVWWAKFWAAGQTKDDRDNDPSPTFIGIDVEPERIAVAKDEWSNSVIQDPQLARINVHFHCANALQHPELWLTKATVIFVYLIPRGLRLLAPLLTGTTNTGDDHSPQAPSRRHHEHLRTIVSFMNKVPNTVLVERMGVQTPKQPDAVWPLYIHKLLVHEN